MTFLTIMTKWFAQHMIEVIITFGAIAAGISAILAVVHLCKTIRREKPNIEIGFAPGDQIVDQITTKPSPEISFGREVGQRIYFRVHNHAKFPIKTPIVSVRFPQSLKHIKFVDKPDGSREFFEGSYAVNSDLWGLGKGSTDIKKNLPNSMWEISSIATYLLGSEDRVEFFIRFLIPNEPMDYNLTIRLDGEGTKSITRQLKLIANPN